MYQGILLFLPQCLAIYIPGTHVAGCLRLCLPPVELTVSSPRESFHHRNPAVRGHWSGENVLAEVRSEAGGS